MKQRFPQDILEGRGSSLGLAYPRFTRCTVHPLPPRTLSVRLPSRPRHQAMTTCRRTMIAEALGEQGGGKGLCNGGCDVCSGGAEDVATIDATAHAATLVRWVEQAGGGPA